MIYLLPTVTYYLFRLYHLLTPYFILSLRCVAPAQTYPPWPWPRQVKVKQKNCAKATKLAKFTARSPKSLILSLKCVWPLPKQSHSHRDLDPRQVIVTQKKWRQSHKFGQFPSQKFKVSDIKTLLFYITYRNSTVTTDTKVPWGTFGFVPILTPPMLVRFLWSSTSHQLESLLECFRIICLSSCYQVGYVFFEMGFVLWRGFRQHWRVTGVGFFVAWWSLRPISKRITPIWSVNVAEVEVLER